MRKTTKVATLLLAATAMLLACTPTDSTLKVTGDYLTGAKAKDTYNAFLNYNINTLNNAISGHSEDGQHIANFVDGLVENDEFGRLKLALATKAEVNSSSSEFTFTIKEGVPWLKSDGTQYSANIDGTLVPQFVTAQDFLTTLQHNLDYSDVNLWSDTYYLPAMFLTGGWEYWAYTYIQYRLSVGKFRDYYDYYFGEDATLQTLTNPTPEQLAQNAWCYAGLYGNVWADEIPTGDDVADIAGFRRVGAEVVDGKLKFTLNSSMPYFTSVLTYSCFLPMNAHFVDEVGYANFGLTKEDFLYNGAFILNTWNESTVKYTKNTQYFDAAKVHINTVTYTVLSGDLGYDFTRTKYENNEIDGFTVSQYDSIGWSKYVAGTDGTGTLESPASDDAYARFVEGVDSAYVMMINMERTTEPAEDQNSNLNDLDIVNANKAVKLDAVRSILLNGMDMSIYNKRYGTTQVYQEQMQINTYTPRNFCLDSANNKDYVDYVYEAYAEKFGITVEEAAAKLEPGQIAGTNASVATVASIRTQLLKEVSAFNAANPTDAISYPIKVEYLGLNFDTDELGYDTAWVEAANERINGVTINADHVTASLPLAASYPYVEIVNNTGAADAATYQAMGSAGYYNMYVMGWGPDYADPLTYLNTFVTGGDMSGYTNTGEAITTYSATGTTLTSRTMLEHYDELVAEGKAITDDIAQRYSKFAEAEVELIYEQHLIRPLYNRGQGWRVTVTRTIAYEKPTATYGLSENKLKGMWVLEATVGAAARIACKAIYENKKANLDPNYTILTLLAA